jgi:hypothetical protein
MSSSGPNNPTSVISDGFYESGAGGIGTWYSSTIAKEKVLYLSFDSQPNAAIKEMHVHIEYKIA